MTFWVKFDAFDVYDVNKFGVILAGCWISEGETSNREWGRNRWSGEVGDW